MNPTTNSEADSLPMDQFDESIELDDPRPFEGWEPSPAQIERWALQIRDEREAMKLEDVDSED